MSTTTRRGDEPRPLPIHEFAHHKVSNHLSEDFADECCRLGAKLRTVPVFLEES